MRRTPVVALTLLGVLSAGVAPRASATVLLSADFDDLVREARAIVHARIVDVQPQWVEGRRRIESFVTFEAFAYLKGDLGRIVTIRVPGGELGGYRSVLIGAPVFRAGDEAILFLSTRDATIPHVLGLGQGAYRIFALREGGAKLVRPPAGASVMAGAARPLRGDPGRRPIGVEEFARRVRDALSRVSAAARRGVQ